jgi:hypothetical protein
MINYLNIINNLTIYMRALKQGKINKIVFETVLGLNIGLTVDTKLIF